MRRVKTAKKVFHTLLDREVELEASLKFKVYVFNPDSSKKALVVHGWMSKSIYMTKIIQKLILNDYMVVAVDLPGHGASPARRVSWKDSVKALLKVQEHFNGFDLALGHSYGGAMILNATGIAHEVSDIEEILKLKNIVMIASPVKIQTAINLFAKKMGLSEYEGDKLISKIEEESGTTVDKLDGVYLQKTDPTATKIHCIHDVNDKIIPFEDASYLQELGDSVSLSRVRNLGHISVIYDSKAMGKLNEHLLSIS